jgi:hypothetical protein
VIGEFDSSRIEYKLPSIRSHHKHKSPKYVVD